MTTREHQAEELAVAANNSAVNPKCPACKQGIFYLSNGFAIRAGHVYSQAGKSELGLSGLCEFCFDSLEGEEERNERLGIEIDPTVPHVLPLEGQLLQIAVMGDYDSATGRYDTSDSERATVITSEVDAPGPRRHRPILDIDFPAQLVPSTTPGHFHLYLDVEVPHEAYMILLDALSAAGIIEPGYARASKARGHTDARLPWIRKRKTPAELVDEAIAQMEVAP
jgi:hypothetical protein